MEHVVLVFFLVAVQLSLGCFRQSKKKPTTPAATPTTTQKIVLSKGPSVFCSDGSLSKALPSRLLAASSGLCSGKSPCISPCVLAMGRILRETCQGGVWKCHVKTFQQTYRSALGRCAATETCASCFTRQSAEILQNACDVMAAIDFSHVSVTRKCGDTSKMLDALTGGSCPHWPKCITHCAYQVTTAVQLSCMNNKCNMNNIKPVFIEFGPVCAGAKSCGECFKKLEQVIFGAACGQARRGHSIGHYVRCTTEDLSHTLPAHLDTLTQRCVFPGCGQKCLDNLEPAMKKVCHGGVWQCDAKNFRPVFEEQLPKCTARKV